MHEKLTQHARGERINADEAVNLAVHKAIVALASNRWLTPAIADLRKIVKLAGLQQLHVPGRLGQSVAEHLALFAAVMARDPAGAQASMRTHLMRQREVLRELVGSRRSRLG